MRPSHISADPLYSIFCLLTICRQGPASERALRRAWQQRQTGAPLSFHLRLCRAAHLLDDHTPPRPTLLGSDWLARPRPDQMRLLLRAWRDIPLSPALRRRRRRLLERLARADLDRFEPAYRRELTGLRALGLLDQADGLTTLGRALLRRDRTLPLEPPTRWSLLNDILIVPFPADWALLWKLEAFLAPASPGRYPLTPAALALAAQRGALEQLRVVLECGLGSPLPDGLLSPLAAAGGVRLLPSPVLEFDDPAELARLSRTTRALRAEHLLSPRHVLITTSNSALLRRLIREGRLPPTPSPSTLSRQARSSGEGVGGEADRAWLLSLWLAVQHLDLPLDPPPGLLSRLVAGLPKDLHTAARRRAIAAAQPLLDRLAPPHTRADDEPPPPPTALLLERLRRAITSNETIEVLYHAAGRPAPEPRRLSPLLVEPRGPRWYLVAYCHTRRANRTFRLDRLSLPDG